MSIVETFVVKWFSATWNSVCSATVVGKYSWITILISTVLSVYISAIMKWKHEALISACIYLILNFGLYKLSDYATIINERSNKK